MPEILYDQESLQGCDLTRHPLLGEGDGEGKPPIACTDDVLKCDGEGDINMRRCYSEGHIYDVAILLPLNSRSAESANKSYLCESVSTQTSRHEVKKCSDVLIPEWKTSGASCPMGKCSDSNDKVINRKYRTYDSRTRKSFLRRHACILISFLVVAIFIATLAVVMATIIQKNHEIRERKEESLQINHLNEIVHEETLHVDCSALTLTLDTFMCPQENCFENVAEVVLPWRKNRNDLKEQLQAVVLQKDQRHLKVQKSGWYIINSMVTVHSGIQSSANVCITVNPTAHVPVCNRVSMATRSVIPVQVSSRIYLRQNDVISIVVKANDIGIDRNSELEIYEDVC